MRRQQHHEQLTNGERPTRFSPVAEYIGSGDYVGNVKEDAEGDYVLWEDYEALVDRIEKAIAASDCSACNAFLASLLSGRD